jgi:uncharacterized membrane protein
MGLFSNPAKTFFTATEQAEIKAAIEAAERQTSGEIRVHLEAHTRKPVLERAREVFAQLKMHETELKNGVLIYFAVSDHNFAIYAGQGIHEAVPDGFWDSIALHMRDLFKEGRFLVGLTEGIGLIGEKLQEFFPYQTDDINELPDDISYG